MMVYEEQKRQDKGGTLTEARQCSKWVRPRWACKGTVGYGRRRNGWRASHDSVERGMRRDRAVSSLFLLLFDAEPRGISIPPICISGESKRRLDDLG